jgi:hypothetical protein
MSISRKKSPRRPVSMFSRIKTASGMMRFSGVLGRDKVGRLAGDPAAALDAAVFHECAHQVEAGPSPHLHFERNQEIQKPQPVIHLRRPAGLDMRLDEGA